MRCIGLASSSLRRGNHQRFEAALKRLGQIEHFLLRTSSDDVAILAYFLRASCEKFGQASIYHPLRRLAELRPDRKSYVEGFARRQFERGRGILWLSQQQGIERLLQNSSFALCTPTGSGKTLVANLAILKELLLLRSDGTAPLALYLVPSRALAGEVEAKLGVELGREFLVTGLYGGSDWGITDAWLTTDVATVLIATVEKAEALMRYLGPMLIARMSLLIIDEAHQVVVEDNESVRDSLAEHGNRAVRLEGFVSRLIARKPGVVRLALTAVAGGAAHPVARWIESNEDARPVGVHYRSTRQALGVLEVSAGAPRIQLDQMNGHPLAVRGQGGVYIPLKIEAMPQPPPAQRNSLNHFTQLYILWTALHLTEGDRRVLVSISQRPERTMGWFAEAFDLPGWGVVQRFVPPTDGPDGELFAEARLVCIDYCGERSHELRLLDRGIATNHGQMPQRLRRMMVALIERSICRITIATATLTEGVNLPFDMIFLPSLKRTSYDSARKRLNEYPLSVSEFRNLSGRAGRPGSAKGMEGLTLVALPQSVSSTAASLRTVQRGQIGDRRAEYDDLLRRLGAEAAGHAISPLGLLLDIIRRRAMQIPGIDDDGDFLGWLEAAAPGEISDVAGEGSSTSDARLADSLDELDGFILAAIEEAKAATSEPTTSAGAEAILAALWQKTFTVVSDTLEAWMERAFVKRGVGLVENIYPDEIERKRLYNYGYSPHVGRRFEMVAPLITQILGQSVGYSEFDDQTRLELLTRLGEVVAADRGYGFSVRDTETGRELYDHWRDVLAWWMRHSGARGPDAADLRAWQMFVTDNLEFRLGVAIGAVVARTWSEGSTDPLNTPTLDTWQLVTGLPWFAFWAKELLRWGTLEPFVAFALSQGLAKTRSEASELREKFVEWLDDHTGSAAEGDDFIDPRNFLRWARTMRPTEATRARSRPLRAELSGTNGKLGTYAVMPIEAGTKLQWLDASGYRLALSDTPNQFQFSSALRGDYDLVIKDGKASIVRQF